MSNVLDDLTLVATDLLEKRYKPPVHSVASALLTKNGNVFTGVNIDHFNAFVCAEMAALSDAINNGEYEFEAIVTVRKDAGLETTIANMCGKCRQIFHDYAPTTKVLINDGDGRFMSVEELLPFAFTRQREKIQSIIEEIK